MASLATETVQNSYAWFLVMRDGRVVEGTAFFDTSAFNDLWSRVEPSCARTSLFPNQSQMFTPLRLSSVFYW